MTLLTLFISTILASPGSYSGPVCVPDQLEKIGYKTKANLAVLLDGHSLRKQARIRNILRVYCDLQSGKSCPEETPCEIGNRYGIYKFYRKDQDPKSPILLPLGRYLNEECRRNRKFIEEALRRPWTGLKVALPVNQHIPYHMVRDVVTTMGAGRPCHDNDGTIEVVFPFAVVNPESTDVMSVKVGGEASRAPVEVRLGDKAFTLTIGKKKRLIHPVGGRFNYKALHHALQLEHWERPLTHVHVVPSSEHRMEVVLRTLRAVALQDPPHRPGDPAPKIPLAQKVTLEL